MPPYEIRGQAQQAPGGRQGRAPMGRLRSFLARRARGFPPCRVTPWLLAVLAALALLNGCAPEPGYKDVSVQELRAAREPGRVVLDVREPHEHAEGHVPGSTLLPLGQVAARAGQLPKDAPVYVICRSGNRSAQASRTLAGLGFKDVRNVQGGILAWQSAGYPLER
ncbi:rhodanese-like domain-containing protein [Calidithermus terrae]|nr:rhodanese-like domain-containing protein [Calidithermus terrae]